MSPTPVTSAPIPTSKVFQSTHLHSATYTPATHTLTIRFNNGRTYTNRSNHPVPLEVWMGLFKSGSPGNFFDRSIKPYWNGIELPKPQQIPTP